MKALLLLLALHSLGASADQSKLPGVLIVQTQIKKVAEAVQNVDLADALAQEVDDDGRLLPIVWSLTDPIFRTAVEERLIPKIESAPTIEDVRAAMPKLKTEYLILFSAFHEDNEKGQPQVKASARLFKGNKEIWKDERGWLNMEGSITQFDQDNLKHSIARTWVKLMAGTALKDLVPRVRADTPDANPGTSFNTTAPPPSTIPPPPSVADNKQLLIDAMRLLGSKQIAEAISLLRDAVDSAPDDPERREALISALMEVGEPSLAAQEARRAARLMPERLNLWIAAARGWIAAGNPAEAVEDLNEAVSREPEAPETRLLLGEVQIADLKFAGALDHLSKSIEKAPTAYAFRLRAFAHAGLGSEKAYFQDLEAAAKTEAEAPEMAMRRHRSIERATLKLAEAIGADIRVLIQNTRMDPKATDLKGRVEEIGARTRALAAFFGQIPVPETHRNSTERMILAINLLGQSTADIPGSFGVLNEDILTDATISLGEALKAVKAAAEALDKEIG